MGGKIDIQIWHREKVLQLRRLDRLVQSDDFTYLWGCSTELDKIRVRFMINLMHYDTLKHWMQKLNLTYESYSIRDLRTLASKHHIGYYSRKTRVELIEALTEKGVLDANTVKPLDRNETATNSSGCEKRSGGLIN